MDPVTAAMLKEYCGAEQFSGLIMPFEGVDAFLAVESVLQAMPVVPGTGEKMAISKPVGGEQMQKVQKRHGASETRNFPRTPKDGTI